MKNYLLGFSVSCSLVLAAAIDFSHLGCKPAETAIFDLGDAECALLAKQPIEPTIEIVLCEVFDTAQNVIQQFQVQIPTDQAASFVAAHPFKTGHTLPEGVKK
jgi:hypothetical protein